jgi:uracil-DNA glycosylase
LTAVETLQRIAQEARTCTLCGLHKGRTRAVPGEGPADARIMLIGEGPGYHEDRQGRPFVGASGQFLDELLAIAGLTRAEVFIGNVVKCRPPQNRDPQPDEVATCTATYLDRQIEAISPRVIVTLGRFSMGLFLPGERISRIHGQPRTVGGRLIVPMLHPAAALHQPQNRPLIEADFQRLPAILAEAEREAEPPLMQQLSLF